MIRTVLIACCLIPKETLIYSKPFGLSLSKPLKIRGLPFDKLRANGINQASLKLINAISAACWRSGMSAW
jgi:hypothetical protein